MKYIFSLGLFFIFSSIGICSTYSAIKGEIRLDLPKQISSAKVTLYLKESNFNSVLSSQIIIPKATQPYVFTLRYNPNNINPQKQYFVTILVTDLKNNTLLSKDKFPVITFGFTNTLNILIAPPIRPIENQR